MRAYGMHMRWVVIFIICSLIAGCDGKSQPESIKTVAAFSIPLRSEKDRGELLSILRTVAQREGMHVDADSQAELEQMGRDIPDAKMTIYAAVWRGSADDELVASIMDQHDHLGQAWIMFSKGEDTRLATKFREGAMREIMQRWPDTLSLPVMSTGAIPLYGDLIRTAKGYIVN